MAARFCGAWPVRTCEASSWLCRARHNQDDTTRMAHIDWTAAINALHAGSLPCSGGEGHILRLAASLAEGIPVNLNDAVTGLDGVNIDRVVQAVHHAAGQGRHDHACVRSVTMATAQSPHTPATECRTQATNPADSNRHTNTAEHGECGKKALLR